ncbi:MAG: hypothetical protein J6H20_10055, partial [Pyramidobacter sp.]|nr:hypothetical protein [Pyramidobacter sp.]
YLPMDRKSFHSGGLSSRRSCAFGGLSRLQCRQRGAFNPIPSDASAWSCKDGTAESGIFPFDYVRRS